MPEPLKAVMDAIDGVLGWREGVEAGDYPQGWPDCDYELIAKAAITAYLSSAPPTSAAHRGDESTEEALIEWETAQQQVEYYNACARSGDTLERASERYRRLSAATRSLRALAADTIAPPTSSEPAPDGLKWLRRMAGDSSGPHYVPVPPLPEERREEEGDLSRTIKMRDEILANPEAVEFLCQRAEEVAARNSPGQAGTAEERREGEE